MPFFNKRLAFLLPKKYYIGAVVMAGSLGYYAYNNKGMLIFYSLGALRFGRAALTAASIAADYKISLYDISYTSDKYNEIQSQVHTRSAIKLRKLCYKNKGCFIKVGQHIGALDYLLPSEYVDVMKVLHKESPTSPVKGLKKVVREEFGKDVEQLFASFDPTPLASASLAQVHRAKLTTGEDVVIKIQHPHVMKNSMVDMLTMDILFRAVARLFRGFRFQWLAEETRKNLPLELDFIHEGHNCERAQELFGHLKFVKIPRVFWEVTSHRVITMEFCEGGFINDKEYYERNGISPKEVMSNLSKLYSEMIFLRGFIHCDPHPGNLLVQNVNGKPIIFLLDHGLYQHLPDTVRLDYCNMWVSILDGNREGMQRHSKKLGVGKLYPLLACMLTARSWQSVTSGLKEDYSEYEDLLVRKSAPVYLKNITKILNQVPRPLLLILKTNDLIRGLERSLDHRPGIISFNSVSRACVKAIIQDKVENCKFAGCKVYFGMLHYWMMTKLTLALYYYQVLQHLQNLWPKKRDPKRVSMILLPA